MLQYLGVCHYNKIYMSFLFFGGGGGVICNTISMWPILGNFYFTLCFQCLIRTGGVEGHQKHDDKVDDLDPTEDGEASEEPHGAADHADKGLKGDLYILLYLVIWGSVEVDLNQVQGGRLVPCSWGEKWVGFCMVLYLVRFCMDLFLVIFYIVVYSLRFVRVGSNWMSLAYFHLYCSYCCSNICRFLFSTFSHSRSHRVMSA